MKDFIESLPISFLHIFTYSERPNTKALELKPKVPTQRKTTQKQDITRSSRTKS